MENPMTTSQTWSAHLAPAKSGPGSSVPQGGLRVPLGQISTNTLQRSSSNQSAAPSEDKKAPELYSADSFKDNADEAIPYLDSSGSLSSLDKLILNSEFRYRFQDVDSESSSSTEGSPCFDDDSEEEPGDVASCLVSPEASPVDESSSPTAPSFNDSLEEPGDAAVRLLSLEASPVDESSSPTAPSFNDSLEEPGDVASRLVSPEASPVDESSSPTAPSFNDSLEEPGDVAVRLLSLEASPVDESSSPTAPSFNDSEEEPKSVGRRLLTLEGSRGSYYFDDTLMSSEEEPESVALPLLPSKAWTDGFDEYTLQIITNAKKVEHQYLPKLNYMRSQRELSYSFRSILVDWLVDVVDEFKLHTETIFLAVNYIDRFLSVKSVRKKKLQLLGTTCMWIASKYEEVLPPDVGDCCYMTDDTYSKHEVKRMERMVLKTLDFKCSPPTAYFYVSHLSKLSGVSDNSNVAFYAQYLAELTLLDAETYLAFAPSTIGAASVALSRHTHGLPAWDTDLMEKSGGMRVSDLKACIVRLYETAVKAPDCPEKGVREKYKNKKFNDVAHVKPKLFF